MEDEERLFREWKQQLAFELEKLRLQIKAQKPVLLHLYLYYFVKFIFSGIASKEIVVVMVDMSLFNRNKCRSLSRKLYIPMDSNVATILNLKINVILKSAKVRAAGRSRETQISSRLSFDAEELKDCRNYR
ncbi:hypothetical protein NPIL_281151 [Nephila pilipes]|uniref:Uncharacterized protein n=1 Tax=Nephila pilipes TaxID=299642 RepID=A0A8X6KG93_NEPPI|nr:hypothetical protein NPIL_281151 [Nephila pilipes]